MADTTHTVEERIQFTTGGIDQALQDIAKLEKALQKLEKADPKKEVISEEATKRTKELNEETKKTTKSSERLGGALEGGFTGFAFQAQVVLRTMKDIAGWIDYLTGGLRRANKDTMALIASTDRLAKGWGWTEEGGDKLDQLTLDIADVASSLGTLPSTIQSILAAYKDAGLSFEDIAGEIERSSITAADNSFLLYGSLDKVGEAAQTQAEFMDRFRQTVDQSDKALKGIIVDAHSAGIATERFFSSVKDTAAEMNLYGGQIQQVSDLMEALGKNLGAFRGMKEGKELIGILSDLTEEQKLFYLQGRDNLKLAKEMVQERLKAEGKTEEALTEKIEDLEKLQSTLRGAEMSPEQEKDFRAREAEIRRLKQARLESRKLMQIAEAGAAPGAGPTAQTALFDITGPLGALTFMLERFAEKQGKGFEALDLSDAAARLDDLAIALGGPLGDREKGKQLALILQGIQGDFSTLSEGLKNVTKEQKEELEKLVDPKTEAERTRELISKTKGILEKAGEMFERWLPRIGKFVENMADSLEDIANSPFLSPQRFFGETVTKTITAMTGGTSEVGLDALMSLMGYDKGASFGRKANLESLERLRRETGKDYTKVGGWQDRMPGKFREAMEWGRDIRLLYSALKSGVNIYFNDRPAKVKPKGK